jgi:glycerophosphoryl diester phosphodiesterase
MTRPFYIIGHNPNSIPQVLEALKAGANAVEPDVNVYDNNEGSLCISHGEGASDAPPLVEFLRELHDRALEHPELALVEFDCKPKASTAAHGETLLNAIETYLLPGTGLNVIISIANLEKQAQIFNKIRGWHGPRVGFMVDEENNPQEISDFFTLAGVQNHGYGNGISVLNEILGPNVRPSMEHACELRAALGRPKFINVWSVQSAGLQREYIRIGVDSIITDEVAQLRKIVSDEFSSVVHLATRADNPFTADNLRYGLVVHTGDVSMAGTDSRVTFTLTGSGGSATKTIDTGFAGRMERNSTNLVTIESGNLGPLQSITVRRDDSGSGPDWFLDSITVRSEPFRVSAKAIFNRWISSTAPVTVPCQRV